MINSIINRKNVKYSVDRIFDAIYESIDFAIEYMDYGDIQKAIDILQEIKKEIGEEA